MKIWKFWDWPMRVKVLLILVLSAAIPLGVAGYITLELAHIETVSHAKYVLRMWAEILQEQLDDFHRVHLDESWRLSGWQAFGDFAKDPEKQLDGQWDADVKKAFDTAEANYKRLYGAKSEHSFKCELLGVGLVDTNGKVIRGSGSLKKLDDDKKHENDGERFFDLNTFVNSYLRKCLQQNKATISDLYYPRGFEDKAVIAYAQPIVNKQDNKVAAAIVYWADARNFWSILRKFNRDKKLPTTRADTRKNDREAAYLSLIDEHGVRIAHSWGPEEMEFHPTGNVARDVLAQMKEEKHSVRRQIASTKPGDLRPNSSGPRREISTIIITKIRRSKARPYLLTGTTSVWPGASRPKRSDGRCFFRPLKRTC